MHYIEYQNISAILRSDYLRFLPFKKLLYMVKIKTNTVKINHLS